MAGDVDHKQMKELDEAIEVPAMVEKNEETKDSYILEPDMDESADSMPIEQSMTSSVDTPKTPAGKAEQSQGCGILWPSQADDKQDSSINASAQ